jgi:hypothetical protein
MLELHHDSTDTSVDCGANGLLFNFLDKRSGVEMEILVLRASCSCGGRFAVEVEELM